MNRPLLKGGADWSDAQYVEYYKSRCKVTERGCWEWQGWQATFRNRKPGQPGYAESSYRGHKVRVHRKMLEIKLGRLLGPKEQACHECDHPPCINPDHLYPGTNQQNHLDGGARGRMQGQWKTHCKHGHEFTPENTYMSPRPNGRPVRGCKTCDRNRRNTEHYKHMGRERQRRNRLRRAAQKSVSPRIEKQEPLT